ncbi:hypothetical protein FGB62_115g015 [Gracilaria domingensis]|nr:hypothetical protein FGB62_115g015 [Gracilaria domingensis]
MLHAPTAKPPSPHGTARPIRTGASPLSPAHGAAHRPSSARRMPLSPPHPLIMMRHREHVQAHSLHSPSSPPHSPHPDPNCAHAPALSSRYEPMQRHSAQLQSLHRPSRAASPVSTPRAAHCRPLNHPHRPLSPPNVSTARCTQRQNQLSSAPIQTSHCSNTAVALASSRRRAHCKRNAAPLHSNQQTAHRRRRRVFAPTHALLLKLRVRAPESLQFVSAQPTMPDDDDDDHHHHKLSSRKARDQARDQARAEEQRHPSAAGGSTDSDEHSCITSAAEEHTNPALVVHHAQAQAHREPNVVARTARDDQSRAAASAPASGARMRVPVDRQAIWSEVVDEVARRPSSPSHSAPTAGPSARRIVKGRPFRDGEGLGSRAATVYGAVALEEMERHLVDMMNRSRARHSEREDVDLMCYEDPSELALPENEQEGPREMDPLPVFAPPRLDVLDQALEPSEREDQSQEDEAPDADPFAAEHDGDDDLLDMDMDSEPCLSEEEP